MKSNLMYQRRIVVSYWSTDIFYIMSIVNKLTDICDTTLLVHRIQVLIMQFNKLKTSTNQSFLYYLVGLETVTLQWRYCITLTLLHYIDVITLHWRWTVMKCSKIGLLCYPIIFTPTRHSVDCIWRYVIC